MTRILITYGWCRTAYVAAESLARAGFEVFACDAARVNMTRASRRVSGFDRVPDPFQDPERYVEALARVVERRRIDILFPAHEDAVAIRRYEACLPRGLTVACPPLADLERALDKADIVEAARSAGVNAPETLIPTSFREVEPLAERLGLPVVVKTRHGNSGKGVVLAKSAAEARDRYEDLVGTLGLSPPHWPLLQRFVPGGVCGACFLADRGRVLACFAERYLRCKESSFGTSVLREPYDAPRLVDMTATMARALQWTGIGHFDFVVSPDGRDAWLIEMNPRLWGALNLAIANGFDFPRGYMGLLTDGRPPADAFRPVDAPVKSLWIVGELIAGMAEFRRGDLAAPLKSLGRIVAPGRDCVYDDFRWSDPLPLVAALAYYGAGFIRSGGQVNPVRREMLQ